MERKALQILKDGLESEGGAALIPSFSVKVKWGQHDLQGLGNIRKFLAKYPELFSLEGSTVTLSQSLLRKDEAPKTTSKSAPKAPPSSLGRRRLAEDIEEGQGSKMPRHAGAPTSKAWAVEVPNETNGTGLGRAKPDSTAPKASKGMAPKPKHTSAASAAASAISASAAPSGSAGSDVQDVEPAPWHSRRRIQAGSTGAGALKDRTHVPDALSHFWRCATNLYKLFSTWIVVTCDLHHVDGWSLQYREVWVSVVTWCEMSLRIPLGFWGQEKQL